MDIRESLWVILLVVILQLSLGILLYLLSPSPTITLANLAVAIVMMATVAGTIAVVLTFLFRRYSTERAVRVAMMTLTDDERRVLGEILREGKIRQDKLRHRLDISKSKLSALVNNLEKKGAILKLRYHKTNVLRPTKEFGGK